jgi:hypothetical protein
MFLQFSIRCASYSSAGYYKSAVKLRSQLYLLVFGALLPMGVFTVIAARQLLQHELETMERDAIGRARAAMSAVDLHLRASIASLETLASSKDLETGNIAAFHAESQRVLRTQPAWANIGLTSAAKIQLSNAVYVLDKPEPLVIEDESFDAVVRTAKAGIGDVFAGNVVRSPTARVRVPVVYGSEVRYVISAPLNLKYLAGVLESQGLPQDWMITLVDRHERVIVRIPADPAGIPAPDSVREAIERAPEQGWFKSQATKGRSVYTSYVTSPLSGWALGIEIPATSVEAGSRRILTMMAGSVLLAFASGALVAWLIARRIPQ